MSILVETVGCIGIVTCFGRVQIRKYTYVFPNLSVSLRMILTAPATSASAERSFSKLKLIICCYLYYLWSTTGQDCLTNLARFSIESDIAKQIDFESVIQWFSTFLLASTIYKFFFTLRTAKFIKKLIVSIFFCFFFRFLIFVPKIICFLKKKTSLKLGTKILDT